MLKSFNFTWNNKKHSEHEEKGRSLRIDCLNFSQDIDYFIDHVALVVIQ